MHLPRSLSAFSHVPLVQEWDSDLSACPISQRLNFGENRLTPYDRQQFFDKTPIRERGNGITP